MGPILTRVGFANNAIYNAQNVLEKVQMNALNVQSIIFYKKTLLLAH